MLIERSSGTRYKKQLVVQHNGKVNDQYRLSKYTFCQDTITATYLAVFWSADY